MLEMVSELVFQALLVVQVVDLQAQMTESLGDVTYGEKFGLTESCQMGLLAQSLQKLTC